MTGLRTLQLDDVLAIKDDLVEEDRPICKGWTREAIKTILSQTVSAFTYVRDDVVVACCGAIRGKDSWELWAMYSSKFTAFAFARADAAMAFCKKFRYLWTTEQAGSKARFSIPSDLHSGAKYAKLLGGIFIVSEPSKLFSGVTNDIYEVV